MRVLFGRYACSPSGITPESLHAQKTCFAQKSFRSVVLGHINATQATKPHQKVYVASPDGQSSESRQNEDTLKLLDSLLGSMDEGEQARTLNAQRAASTSESDYSEVSETFEESTSLHQLSAPTRGDLYTSIGCDLLTLLWKPASACDFDASQHEYVSQFEFFTMLYLDRVWCMQACKADSSATFSSRSHTECKEVPDG